MATTDTPDFLMRSKHLSYFQQHGRIYAFHNLFGYIIEMSRDLVDLLQFHNVQLRSRDEVQERFTGQFTSEQLDEFLPVFRLFSCLIDSELAEERAVWSMVPVRARWVVYHRPSDRELCFWRTDRDGRSTPDPVEPWAARLYGLIDGETSLEALLSAISDDPSLLMVDSPRKHVAKTLASWVHHDRQYLKFSKGPLSRFGAEHKWPSYLRSTMPFRPFIPGRDPDPIDPLEPLATPINPPHGYYQDEVTDAEAQFRNVETTLSHLLRLPTPILGNDTYADRVTDALLSRGALTAATRDVLEVGAGQGHFAAGVLTRLRDHAPEVFAALNYTILDLAPALRDRQRETLEAAGVVDKVTWVAANAETHDFPKDRFDLLLCNEVVGDFTTVKLSRDLIGLGDELEPQKAYALWSDEVEAQLGETGRLLRTYEMPLRDAPPEFYLNTGALSFVARAARWLRPGATAFITEYGDVVAYPVASTHLDHIEFSIQFGQLLHVARACGLDATVEYVQDVIGIDRDARTLETTRTYFQSLRALFAAHGVPFDKRAYTHDEVIDLLTAAGLSEDTVGDLRYRIVDERCMGLAVHEFKALIAKKPVTAASASSSSE